jgi:predicted O-methyltransferase YrrM
MRSTRLVRPTSFLPRDPQAQEHERNLVTAKMARPVAQTLTSELSASELDCALTYLRSPSFTGPCLEVGTAAGGTLCAMMAGCAAAARPQFVVVDNMEYFPDQLATVRRNLERHGLDPSVVDFQIATSVSAFPLAAAAGKQFEFILIDACHKIRQVTEDLRWTRLLRVGGVVCLHDYGGPHRGVTLAADRFLRRYSNYTRERLEGSLLVLRKTAPSATLEVQAGDHRWATILAPWLQLQVSFAKRRRRWAARF